MNLQLGENLVSSRDGNTASGLKLGVGDLAMVNDNGVTASAGRRGQPANALAELAFVIRGEDLTGIC